MKSTIAVLALATVASFTLANASDPYRTNAGESEQDNVVKQQLGDASGYRTNAGESESDNVVKIQLGSADNSQYRNQAGEEDKHQPQNG